MALLDTMRGDLELLLDSLRDSKEGELHLLRVGEPEETLEADARAVFVLRLSVIVALVLAGLSRVFTEVCLCDAISAEDGVLAALCE